MGEASDLLGPTETPRQVDVLSGWQLCPGDILGHLGDSLQGCLVQAGAAAFTKL